MKGTSLLDFFNAARWVAIFASAFIYFRIVKMDLFGAACLLYALFTWLSLTVNDCTLYSVTEFVLPCCAIALLGDAVTRKHPLLMLTTILVVSSAISVINLWSIFAFPEGIEPAGKYYYLVGHRNWAITAILPSIFASLIFDDYRGKRLSLCSICMTVIGYTQLVMAYSATSIAILTASLAIYGMLLLPKMRSPLTLCSYLAIYIVSFFAIVILRVQHLFSFIIVDILHKDLSFTGRTSIWDQALQAFATNPVLGTGKDVFTVNGQKISSAHNMLLETLVQGGILGLSSFLMMTVCTAVHLFKTRRALSSALLSLVIGAFILVGFSEQIRWPFFFLLLGMGASWTPLEAAE